MAQNADTVFGGNVGGVDTLADHPLVGIDSIDGVPCISFPTAWNKSSYVGRSTDLLTTANIPLAGTAARTVLAVILPQYNAGAFGITGGAVVGFWQQGRLQNCVFDLESNFVANGAYAWANVWRGPDLNTNNCQWGPQTGGGVGPYNNVPTLGGWYLGTSPAIMFRVNNVPKTLAPLTRAGIQTTLLQGAIVGSGVEALYGGNTFYGSIAEILVYDFDLTTNPAAHATTMAYLATRYPSVPIVV